MNVHIAKDLCKGCKICAYTCPQKLFSFSQAANRKGYNYAVVQDASGCIGCKLCEKSCPDLAICVQH